MKKLLKKENREQMRLSIDHESQLYQRKDIANYTILVTGAAGGIGSHLARRLGSLGSKLILTDLKNKKDLLNDLQEELAETYGTLSNVYDLDLKDVEQIQDVVHQIHESHSIDVLINNAGVNMLVPSLYLTENQWDHIVDTNLKGTFFMTQQIGKKMVRNKSGHIIFISSQHGLIGNVDRAAYCASKAGLLNMCKALAVEWARYNIKLNCVSPTFVITENNEKLLQEPQFKRQYLSEIPLGDYATPEDITQAILFLIESEMITGQNLVVDGGWTAK